jgi:hypothetical protein
LSGLFFRQGIVRLKAGAMMAKTTTGVIGGDMKTLLRIIAAIAAFVAAGWVAVHPAWDSWTALTMAIGFFVSTFLPAALWRGGLRQQQSVGRGGIGVQSGGDSHVGSINVSKEDGRD